jgi:hypothetical protein
MLSTFTWPLLGLVFSFFYKGRGAFILIFICAFWFGFTFAFSNSSLDSWRYAEALVDMKRTSNQEFLNHYIYGYLTNQSALDLYQPIITFLFAKLGASKELLFSFFVSVMFILQYLSYMEIKKLCFKKSVFFYFMCFAIFFLCVPIFYVNGVRFYTASWFFILGCLGFYLGNKKSFLTLVMVSPLVHFSFIFLVLLVPFFKLPIQLGKNLILALIIFSASIGNWVLGFISSIVLNGPIGGEALNQKASGYLDENYVMQVDELSSQANIIETLGGLMFYYLLAAIFIYLTVRRYEYFCKHRILITFWALTCSCLIISLLVLSIPSMGRFAIIFELSCLIFILLYQSQKSHSLGKKINKGKFTAPIILIVLFPAFFLRFIVVTRLALEVIGIQFFLPIVFSLFVDNQSIYSFL